jgi:hypothetical protein
MTLRHIVRTGLFIVFFCGTAFYGQESTWRYEHRADDLARHESDDLMIRGHYLNPLPVSHDEGTPTFTVSCSAGHMDAIVIATGVVIHHEFGASPKLYAQIDDDKPKWDREWNRAGMAVQDDSKTLIFGPGNRIGGIDMLFAKKCVLTVEVYGDRVVGMEFEMPSDYSGLHKYCGFIKPRQR